FLLFVNRRESYKAAPQRSKFRTTPRGLPEFRPQPSVVFPYSVCPSSIRSDPCHWLSPSLGALVLLGEGARLPVHDQLPSGADMVPERRFNRRAVTRVRLHCALRGACTMSA